ncbi:LLM class flavin-dependent oxidoreductase [Amycolatopsis sp. CA-128772]|uniref:LLM class flavin-dependent oxidoreductase n=1 Tax=Amycolatopsis sp. CA-128772 TaxID=2073159 RepID=UPI001304D9C0|nr:LLM class flavin-dependent oxidoreductase [Amycolatopsis sp. CA-128772]
MARLVAPDERLHPAWLDAHAEWGPGPHEDGFGLLATDEVAAPAEFSAWVARLAADAGCTYRWIVENGLVLGGIALRHGAGEVVRHAGHIGYRIRPSARGRGLATWALRQMLTEAARRGMDHVVLVCAADNTASARTIERQGGVLDILPCLTNPVTGRRVRTDERFAQALTSARHAEEFGFDAVALGERHAGPFLSSGVTVLLGAIAATTGRVRIQTGASVLSIHDPLRVAEDYATVDQLSRGRLELVIGKGNELRQLPMFGIGNGDQRDALAEKYELLRRLRREEDVTWDGRFRGPLDAVTSLPRPFAGAPRVWHGPATTVTSAELAAKRGYPLFSANAIQPRDNYTVLIEHYRKHYAGHGHDPRFAFVGAGAGFLYLAGTTQEAREAFGPTYEKLVASFNQPGNSLPTMIPHEQQLAMLERFASEVVPVVRAAASTTLWTDADPYGGRPAVHGRTTADAAGAPEGAR